MQELQRVFNDGGYVRRALASGYVCCRRECRTIRFRDEPEPLDACMIAWSDADGVVRFYAQCFLRPNRELAASSLLDPKFIRDEHGMCYKLRT